MLVTLHADTLMQPILLDTLGHEVGHLLMLELIAEHKDGMPGSLESGTLGVNRWRRGNRDSKSYRRLLDRFSDVLEEGFFGEIDGNDQFIELAADLTEYWLLGFGSPRRWRQSFMLRLLMAAPVVQQDQLSTRSEVHKKGNLHALVPSADKGIVRMGVVRTILVTIVLELLRRDDSTDDYGAFLDDLHRHQLEELRVDLREKCLVGASREVLEGLDSPEGWTTFLEEAQLLAPWLFDHELAPTLRRFAKALKGHVIAGQQGLQQSERAIWHRIREEMARIRASILPLTERSLYIQHWIETKDIERGFDRDEIASRPEYQDSGRPWSVVPQPTVNRAKYEAGEALEWAPEVHLLQRGRIHPSTPASADKMFRARARFLGRLMLLVPAWRKATYERINQLEAENGAEG